MSRKVGDVNEITKVTREVFSEAFIKLGGVEALVDWANGLEGTCTTPNNKNKKLFYTLFAKVLPKELKVEDVNRSHEQFIEAMRLDNEHKQITKGIPAGMIEAPVENEENMSKVT